MGFRMPVITIVIALIIVGVLLWLELVSKMPPERYPEAGEVKEGVVNGEQMFVTN